MIEVKGLYKSFDDKTVLSDINATFENGKTNLIIGQSGSGKTVLMKCIVGLLTPEKGEVLYDGRNLVLMGKKEKKMLRKEMGMIFQSAALFDSMTVFDNVMFPLNMFSNDIFRTFPLFMSLININHLLTNSQYRVHIMRIDNGRHVIFLRNIVDQIINHQ